MYSIFLSALSVRESRTAAKRKRPPSRTKGTRQLHQLVGSIRAESRKLHQPGSRLCADINLASRGLILFPFQISSADGGRRSYYAVAARVVPHHSGDLSPSDPPLQRCLQFDTRNYRRVSARQSRNRAAALVLSTLGARCRSARDSQCSLSALITYVLGCVERLTTSGGSYRGDGAPGAVWHVLCTY